MIEKFVYFTKSFEPTNDFKQFCESLGYIDIFSKKLNNITDTQIETFVFDKRIVEYIESHKDFQDKAMKGNISNKYKIGYAGLAYIVSVDTSKLWQVSYIGSTPVAKYVNYKHTSKGYIYIK